MKTAILNKYRNHNIPNFHDGNLHGMISLAGDLYLLVSSTDSHYKTIKMCKLHEMKSVNFLGGNIILDLEVFTGEASESDFRDVIYYYFRQIKCDSVDTPYLKDKSFLTLLSIQSSYGCDLCVLSESIDIFDVAEAFRVPMI